VSVSQSGTIEVAKLLVQHGANANSQDGTGRAPLRLASLEGHAVVAQLFLDHGADVNGKNQDHWTESHLDSIFRYFETVEVLLRQAAKQRIQLQRARANVEMRDDSGRTPSA
jgi:ankyrin repeat protein